MEQYLRKIITMFLLGKTLIHLRPEREDIASQEKDTVQFSVFTSELSFSPCNSLFKERRDETTILLTRQEDFLPPIFFHWTHIVRTLIVRGKPVP